jgi:hypothetical protein
MDAFKCTSTNDEKSVYINVNGEKDKIDVD